jgi:hypothetical protein
MLSPELRQRLSIGDCTGWASDLSVDHLQALLWMVGEFVNRCGPILVLAKRNSTELAAHDDASRAYDALLALLSRDWKNKSQAFASSSLFSQEFRQELRLGKHSAWAADLTEIELEAVLSILGHFAEHAKPLLDLLDDHASETVLQYQFVRSRYALEAIVRIVGGERYDLAEATRRVRQRLVDSGV